MRKPKPKRLDALFSVLGSIFGVSALYLLLFRGVPALFAVTNEAYFYNVEEGTLLFGALAFALSLITLFMLGQRTRDSISRGYLLSTLGFFTTYLVIKSNAFMQSSQLDSLFSTLLLATTLFMFLLATAALIVRESGIGKWFARLWYKHL